MEIEIIINRYKIESGPLPTPRIDAVPSIIVFGNSIARNNNEEKTIKISFCIALVLLVLVIVYVKL